MLFGPAVVRETSAGHFIVAGTCIDVIDQARYTSSIAMYIRGMHVDCWPVLEGVNTTHLLYHLSVMSTGGRIV